MNKSITKEKMIPLWAGISFVIKGPPKSKENNQNIYLMSSLYKRCKGGGGNV